MQNPGLYLKYKVHKDEMKKFNPRQNHERILWHGAPPSVIESIAKYGFDRGYSGTSNGGI